MNDDNTNKERQSRKRERTFSAGITFGRRRSGSGSSRRSLRDAVDDKGRPNTSVIAENIIRNKSNNTTDRHEPDSTRSTGIKKSTGNNIGWTKSTEMSDMEAHRFKQGLGEEGQKQEGRQETNERVDKDSGSCDAMTIKDVHPNIEYSYPFNASYNRPANGRHTVTAGKGKSVSKTKGAMRKSKRNKQINNRNESTSKHHRNRPERKRETKNRHSTNSDEMYKYAKISMKTIDTLANMTTPAFMDIPKSTDMRRFFCEGNRDYKGLEPRNFTVNNGVIRFEMKIRKKSIHLLYTIHVAADAKSIVICTSDVTKTGSPVVISTYTNVEYSVDGLSKLQDVPGGGQSPLMIHLCAMLLVFKGMFVSQFKNQRKYWLVPRNSLNTRRRTFGEMKFKKIVCNMIFAKILQRVALCRVRKMCQCKHTAVSSECAGGGSCSYCFDTTTEIDDYHRTEILKRYWPSSRDSGRVKEIARKAIVLFLEMAYLTAKTNTVCVTKYFDVSAESVNRLYNPARVMSLFLLDQFWSTDVSSGVADSAMSKINVAVQRTIKSEDVCYCMNT